MAAFPPHLGSYYQELLSEYERAYDTAESARLMGLDLNYAVEPKTVFDLSDRVNQMLGLDQFEGLADRLRELLSTTTKEKAALTISQEIALGKFGAIDTTKALEYGVRAGLAVITDGVTVAPIQGIYSVSIKQNNDNSEYASVSFAGPMRSAGGTEAAFCLAIADVTAKKLGLSNYRANEDEIGRFTEELRIYEREVGNFQYRVTDDDIRVAISNLPVEIDGIETDPAEVVVHRNLSRVSTDRVRGGALRVLNDGIIGRAHKLEKKLATLNIVGWEWLRHLKGGTQQSTNETEHAGAHFEEVISGRAVISSPGRRGGLRLRYGRSMNTGLSTIGIHPALSILLDYPVVPGTQVKVDLPGKAATIAFVDSIEGPTVLLSDNSIRKIESIDEAEKAREKLVRIVDLGDVLISFGDFLENNKNLPESPYVVEWWKLDLENALSSPSYTETKLPNLGVPIQLIKDMIADPWHTKISPEEAFIISESLGIPLHPMYTYRFDRVKPTDILELRNSSRLEDGDVIVDITSHHIQEVLRTILVPNRFVGEHAVIDSVHSKALSKLLALGEAKELTGNFSTSFELIKELSGITLGRQSTSTVGIRVGRPEKAMLRHLKPPVHTLFPVGPAGGPSRNLISAATKEGVINLDVINLICPSCGIRRLSVRCEECGEDTARFLTCPRCGDNVSTAYCPRCKIKTVTHSRMDFDLKSRLEFIGRKIDRDGSKPVKGVRSLTSQSRTPEPIEKGVLRSRNDVFVYKDGTIRIDITNAPLTHFRPSDTHTELDVLIDLGYTKDHKGDPLVNANQVVELKPQDILLPIDVARDLVRIGKFVDDELSSIYGLDKFYHFGSITDTIGEIVIGLAPHTSVGVVGRIIGFTETEVCFANPCWHAAKRRDCDGDGDSVLLLMDALLNFSIEFIPDQIGGLMDTPLLIQPVVLPNEVDEQAHNFDIAHAYPREFYEATKACPSPSTLEPLVERIGSRLSTERQFYDFGFTHSTSKITIHRAHGAYSTLKTLTEKISKQIEVAEKVESVSAKEVVESIIKTHLIRDIMGNTKKYASQSFKCKNCGAKYRRPPVTSRCSFCDGELRETLTQASVEKYLAIAQKLSQEYDVDEYLRNRLEMAERELDQLFQRRDKSTQTTLTDFEKEESFQPKKYAGVDLKQ